MKVVIGGYKKVRCQQCRAWLCSRRLCDGKWIIHFKKSAWEVLAEGIVVIACGKCRTITRVDARTGIIDWQRYDPSIPRQDKTEVGS